MFYEIPKEIMSLNLSNNSFFKNTTGERDKIVGFFSLSLLKSCSNNDLFLFHSLLSLNWISSFTDKLLIFPSSIRILENTEQIRKRFLAVSMHCMVADWHRTQSWSQPDLLPVSLIFSLLSLIKMPQIKIFANSFTSPNIHVS